MEKPKPKIISLVLGCSLLFHSCAGSFGTWNQVKNWNEEVEDNFIKKFIFYSARVIPVYEICYLTDVLVLNPIEYWNGRNPIAEAESIQIIKCNDNTYNIITTSKGYVITKKGNENEVIYLLYNSKGNDWTAVINGRIHNLVNKNADSTITVQLPDGTPITINPNEEGKNAIVLAEGQKLIK